jgi:3-hydroxyacyl-CoA dehydrogenase / enoyl-CoA hydratase / 3-hydroxybutyryl-CoA epimerase / enoyl-CoA isomerase
LVVEDCPGFLVNRVLGAYMTAFLALVHEGADFLQIDRVMETWGLPMGPAYLMDVAGIDTLDKALAVLSRAYPSVMGTPFLTAIQHLAAKRRYGQKSGMGFYRYEADAKGRPRRCEDPSVVTLLGEIQPEGPRDFDDETIEERLLLPLILEAARCLEERVCSSAAEIDLAMRLGTGFPPHRGGPLWYADSIGLAEVARRCARFASLGGLYDATAASAFLAAKNKFYGADAY